MLTKIDLTKIPVEKNLINEALVYAHLSNVKELISFLLKEYVENHRALDLRDLQGKVKFHKGYDYKALRAG